MNSPARLPGPGGEERLERGAQHDGGAVALQLGGVLAGVAVRRAADRAQADVEHVPGGVHEAAVDQLSVPVLGHGPAVGGAEHGLCGGDRPGAGDSDYAYGGDDLAVAMAAMVSDMLKTPLKKAAPEDGFFDGMVFSRA